MPVWGTCSPSKFNELELIHERAARIIFNLPRNVNVLQKANWRPLQYIYKKRVATLMQNIYHEKAPTDLLNLFEKQSQTRTRQKHCFDIFRPKTEIGRTALRYRRPITWNALPTETKECENSDPSAHTRGASKSAVFEANFYKNHRSVEWAELLSNYPPTSVKHFDEIPLLRCDNNGKIRPG